VGGSTSGPSRPLESNVPGTSFICEFPAPTQGLFTGKIAQVIVDGEEVGAHQISFDQQLTVSFFDGSQEQPFGDPFGQSTVLPSS